MGESLVYISSFVIGIVFGSFYTVVGLRIPQGKPFINARSACPACKQQLRWFELIPVIAYFMLQGHCRHCQKSISPLYPFIECSTGLLFVFCYYIYGFQLELLIALLFVSLLMIIFVSDVKYMIIPNNILLVFFIAFILLRYLQPLNPWWSSLLGAIVGFVIIALIIIGSRGGMGAGDMKLFGVIGIILGFGNVLLTFLLACMLGAIIGVSLLLLEKIENKQPIPFGPSIIVAAITSYFFGEEIVSWYLQMLI